MRIDLNEYQTIFRSRSQADHVAYHCKVSDPGGDYRVEARGYGWVVAYYEKNDDGSWSYLGDL
jgi:hypothetical protein